MFLLGLLVAYFISRSIANPVKKVTAGLSEIAGGNLAVEPIHIKNKDEVGDMATAFNTDVVRFETNCFGCT